MVAESQEGLGPALACEALDTTTEVAYEGAASNSRPPLTSTCQRDVLVQMFQDLWSQRSPPKLDGP